jgi:hypothetical protein
VLRVGGMMSWCMCMDKVAGVGIDPGGQLLLHRPAWQRLQ